MRSFAPVLPISLVVTLAAAAILIAAGREWRGRHRLRFGWLPPLCLLLRILAILALILVLLNPSRPEVAPESSATARNVVLLLDASDSMTLPAASGTRWEEANDFAEALVASYSSERDTSSVERSTFSHDLDRPTPAREPNGRRTRLSAALESLLAVEEETLPGAIVVISDGRIHDRDRMAGVLAMAEAAKVPIVTRCVGIDKPLRNLRLDTVNVPRMVRPRSPVSLHARLSGSAIEAGETIRLELRDEADQLVTEAELTLDSQGKGETLLAFESGLRTARYFLEARTTIGDPEIDPEDNRHAFTLEIATEKLRVLFVEGTHVKRTIGDSGHWWNDMEHMTRAWDATGEIEYDCLTPVSEYADHPNLVGVSFQNGEMRTDPRRRFPATREELYRYDVMLISDVPVGNFSREQMDWVVDWVEKRGGGFLMGGGYTTFDSGDYDKTPWEKIVPVDMKSYGNGFFQRRFEIDIPASVRAHPLWSVSSHPSENERALDSHPPFTGMNRVLRAKPGALVLATRRDSDEPVIAVQAYGRGRTMAFLPDPNGGWARFYLGWGPDGGPAIGAHTELGHGNDFRFKEKAARIPSTPPPPHPSPYYAQYWVNVVRWLGQHSIRWQRDALAARVLDAQAHPSGSLEVMAEVLAVTETAELLSLDVGARLADSGTHRVRLEYDRDRRAFTGRLALPPSIGEKEEIEVLFDTETRGKILSQAVRVGVYQGNPEFENPAPDPAFLAELATASGGRPLAEARDFATLVQATDRERRRSDHRAWNEPLWSSWGIWVALALCLSLEWSLRRFGRRSLHHEGTTPLVSSFSAATFAAVAFALHSL